MSTSQQPYLSCVRSTLEAAFCVISFPHPVIDRCNRPE
ncbi:actin-related protein 2/3 complex subunit 4, partial [Kipferlia bialata]|eukprot:g13766.t1